jgi:signal transduction histidine kinase
MTEIVQNALSMITLQCKHENINIHFDHPPQAVFIVANPFRMEQVVLNLLSNARDAVLERFDIFNDQKSIRICLAARRDKIVLEISDNGAGMTEEVRQRIFEPFFTTKSQSKGTGLGLSICYGIINDLGGTLSCESVSGEGSTLRVELPNLFEGTQL